MLAEGASAQYAIVAKGAPLMDTMLGDLCSRLEPGRATMLEEITAEDVLAATNTIGIDLGEGTCNVVVFSNGRFNVEALPTFSKGHGSVLESAIKAMEDQGIESGFTIRKELAEFLRSSTAAARVR